MNWIKGFFFGKIVNVQKYEETIKEYIEGLPKFSFQEDGDTKKLEKIWETLTSSKDLSESKGSFKKLVKLFIELNKNKVVVKLPHVLFEDFSNCFKEYVTYLDTEMRKEQSKRDFQEPENNDILEAIEIITRFSNNRYHLLSLDLIPKVVTLLQKVFSTCSKIYSNYSEVLLLENTENIPQGLNEIKKLISNLDVKRNLQVMISYLIETKSLQTLIESFNLCFEICQEESYGFIFQFLEQMLSTFQVIFLYGVQEKNDQFSSCGGLEVFLKTLTWPKDLVDKLTNSTWDKLDYKSINYEMYNKFYDLQIIILKIISQSISLNDAYFYKMEGLHISDKIFDIGLWISVVYAFDEVKSYSCLEDIYEIIKQNQTPNVESFDKTIENMDYMLNKEYKPKKKNPNEKEVNPSLIKKIVNKRLLNYFMILLEFIEHSRLMNLLKEDDMIDYTNNKEINTETLNEVKFACLLIGIFQEKNNEPTHYKQAREKLKNYSDFQFYFLDQLIVLFTRNPNIPHLYVKNHLYDILFSNYFYFFGGDHNELNAYQKDIEIEKNLTNLVSIQVSKVIREKIFSIIRFIAKDKQSFENEIYKLQEILGTFSSNSLLVCEISELLFDLFEAKQDQIMPNVIQYKSISVLSYVSHHQLQRLNTSRSYNDMLHSLEAVYATFNILNLILLNENNRMIALEDNNTIDTLFSSLYDFRFKDFAYCHLKKLMTFDQTENNSPFNLIINSCYQKFKIFTTKENITSYDIQIIMDLFKLIQDICSLKVNAHLIQKEFSRDIKILPDLFKYNPKNFNQVIISKNVFCLEFLKTFGELLFENENNKHSFEHGYKKLEKFVLDYFDQKPTSEVIDRLIDIMLDGASIKDQYSNIATPQIIPIILKLLCYCPDYEFLNFIEKFIKILESSVSNQNSCVNIQLFDFILKMISTDQVTDERQQIKLIEVLGILAGFSITVKELKSFFYYVKEKSKDTKTYLLTSLFKVLQTNSFLSPESFFDLDGNSSGLELPIIEKWPTSKGYTISMWFRIETLRDVNSSPNYQPRLYSFLNSSGEGFEAFFTSKSFKNDNTNIEPLLFVQVMSEGKKSTGYFDFNFHEKVWYHLTIVHSYPKSFSLSKNEVRLYINGKLEGRLAMKYPNIKKIDRGRIANNHQISQGTHKLYRENPFNGQMSTIYMFDESLSESYIKGLYDIGPNYISIFHPSDSILYDKTFNFLFDGNFSSKIVFCLNPKSKYKTERILINNAYELTSEIQYIKLLSGTKICITHSIKDIIACLGGIKVLFPLFLNLDRILQHSDEDSYLAYELLTLILDLLKNHQENQEEMILSRGFQVINFLLKQISPQHMCSLMVKLIPKFVSNLFSNIQLFNDAVMWILFDFKLWIYSDSKVQKGLIEELIYFVDKMKSDYFRKQITVQKVLDTMRMFYWYQIEPDSSEGSNEICNPITKKIIGKRPPLNEVQEIRSLLLELIRVMTSGFPNQMELDSMMLFLVECNDSKQLSEILFFIIELLFGPNQAPISEMISKQIEIFYYLLNNKDEDVRIYSLKIIGKLITENQKLKQKYGFDQIGAFSFISQALLKYPFTSRNFDALREILIGKVTNPKTKQHLEDIDRFKCEFPNLFPVIFQLILNAEQKVQERVIYDFKILLNSKEIKDNFIQQPLWQNYFIDLIVHTPYQSVNVLCVEIFSDLIFYALIHLKHGWKFYEETIAILHYHSFSEDAFHLTKLFLSDISLRVTNLYISSFQSKLIPFNLSYDHHSMMLGNFFQFLTLVEEYLFYYFSMSKEMKKTQIFEPTKFDSPKISRVTKIVESKNSESLPTSPRLNSEKLSPSNKSDKDLPKSKSSLTLKIPIPTPIFPETERSPSEGLFSKTISMFRKFSISPMFSCEDEINMTKTEDNVWVDLEMVDKLIKLMSMIKVSTFELYKISQFDQFSQYMGEFRVGGSMRIALRFFRILMREMEPKDYHFEMIRKIFKQDSEAELLYEKYSDIHDAVNLGNYDREEEVFQNRLFSVLNILYEKLKTKSSIYSFVIEIIILRKKLLEPKMKRFGDILDEKHPLIKKNSDMRDIRNYFSSDKWKSFLTTYLIPSSSKIIQEENEFYSKMTISRKDLMTKIEKILSQIYNSEEMKMKQMNEKKNIDYLISIETKRRLNVKTKIEDNRKLSANYWKIVMQDVANERGPWGCRTETIYWKLDKTENNNRMRTRLKIDYNPIDHTGAAHDSKDNMKQNLKKESNPLDIKGASFFIPKLEIIGENKVEEDIEIIEESIEERSLLKVYCEIITPMQAFSGQMEITNKRLLWVGDKENKCETFGANAITNQLQRIPKDKIWNISDIHEIHLRRCRLVSSAMEIFMVNKTNVFFNFELEKRDQVYKKILSTKPPNLSYEHNISASTIPGQNFIQSGLTKLWVKRKISNFDYLMKLNTFAGRTYNDFNQYPVFPWVIRDYCSKTLDLKSEFTFRNFERPIGAQRNSRLEGLDQRYKDLKEAYDRELQFLKETNSTERPRMQPPCHYGTHYSSSGVVVHLLIRLEPYTTYARILQGGKFDHSDRLFFSIPNSWNCCTSSTGDCKELIPEFFYCPEFLEIRNNLDLGTLQSSKEKIGDVILPPWASTSEEFIRLNREALESDYVSDHLHEWIDLIFGYKQRGKEALEAYNLFHALTYEGYVNIQNVKDPIEKRQIIAQIENYGQTPSQLLQRPHPRRQKVEELFIPFLHNPSKLAVHISHSISNSPIVCIKAFENRVITICKNGMYSIHKFTFINSSMDLVLNKNLICLPFSSEVSIHQKCFAISSKDTIYSCAHWDNSFKVTYKSIQSVFRHKDVVSCLAIDENYLVTGSNDTTLIVWEIQNEKVLFDKPKSILYGHEDEITCVAISNDLDMVVSGSKDRTCIIHTIHGKYVKSINLPDNHSIDLISLSGTLPLIQPDIYEKSVPMISYNYIVIYSNSGQSIYLFSINGKLLKSVKTKIKVSCMTIVMSRFLIYGGGNRVIVRNLYDLTLVKEYKIQSGEVVSVDVSNDTHQMFVGLNTGRLLIFHCVQFKTL